MQVWLQHADFSQETFDLDLTETLKTFESVDWPKELAAEQALAKGGAENCPPGIGIVHPKGQILHVCPGPSGALVHFHFTNKAFGLFRRQKSLTMEHQRRDQIEGMIHAFFDGDWDAIARQT